MDNFYCFACSNIGKNHLDNGTILQDASAWYKDEHCSVIVVSDGHGSENFPRSDRGSKFACSVTIEAVKEFVAGIDSYDLDDATSLERVVTQLCKNILLRWSSAVESDALNDPFTDDEVENVSEKYRIPYLQGERVIHAYGATLLIAVITKNYFLAIRNGDGECVIIDSQGQFHTPIPDNDKNEASFVTSLCDEKALDDFRFYYSKDIPVAAFIASDGIENSYTNIDEQFSLYRNICRMIGHDGLSATVPEVEKALDVITTRGSGDDVSIAATFDIHELDNIMIILDSAAEQRKAKLAEDRIERQRILLEHRIHTKQKRLNDVLAHKDSLLAKLAKIDETHSNIVDELIRLASSKMHTEKTKARIEHELPSIESEIESLRSDLDDLNDQLLFMTHSVIDSSEERTIEDSMVPVQVVSVLGEAKETDLQETNSLQKTDETMPEQNIQTETMNYSNPGKES